jgi:oligopeptide/dipeptide ABC transporter ATP-binding protein
MTGMALLEVRDLHVAFGDVEIIRGVDFDLEAGQTLGVVGESGCGKSMTGFSIMGMLQHPGRVSKGSIKLNGQELVGLPEKNYREVRGSEIALVMQDPFTSLNPMMRVGDQIAEAFRLHTGMSKAEAWNASVDMLDKVGVPTPELSAKKFPHQMSGGQRQRVVIAMAFACKPKVLIADEPTTALDVTLQAQILRLLRELQEKEGTAVVLISHDIGAIAAVSHRIAVFYAGQIVEVGPSEQVLRKAAHPYTRSLLSALPRAGQDKLESIGGAPPDFAKLPSGCAFAPRCALKKPECDAVPAVIPLTTVHSARCIRAAEVEALEIGQGISALASS